MNKYIGLYMACWPHTMDLVGDILSVWPSKNVTILTTILKIGKKKLEKLKNFDTKHMRDIHRQPQ